MDSDDGAGNSVPTHQPESELGVTCVKLGLRCRPVAGPDRPPAGVLVLVCCGQRGAMDPRREVGGRAFGDSGGVSGKFLVADDLTPLSS